VDGLLAECSELGEIVAVDCKKKVLSRPLQFLVTKVNWSAWLQLPSDPGSNPIAIKEM